MRKQNEVGMVWQTTGDNQSIHTLLYDSIQFSSLIATLLLRGLHDHGIFATHHRTIIIQHVINKQTPLVESCCYCCTLVGNFTVFGTGGKTTLFARVESQRTRSFLCITERRGDPVTPQVIILYFTHTQAYMSWSLCIYYYVHGGSYSCCCCCFTMIKARPCCVEISLQQMESYNRRAGTR